MTDLVVDWQPYAARLVDELVAGGLLVPAWREAFEKVPRHVFVPRFHAADGGLVDGTDPTARERWLAAVYSDRHLVTQLTPASGTHRRWPTSSSTAPGLMARMLRLLEVYDGHRVLEIGTGTGYNAALLSHRLGDECVTSIDIDPGLVDAARDRLADLGYRPYLVAGDGADGVPDQAPYDRIIPTAAVPRIPAAWVRQLRLGGLIVVDIRGALVSSLATARKTHPDAVVGRFLPTRGDFMWLRSRLDNPLRHDGVRATVFDFDDTGHDTTTVPPRAFADPGFRFVLQLAVPGLRAATQITRERGDGVFVTADDGSWVEIIPVGDRHPVTYGGPRRLWPQIQAAWDTWSSLDRPARERFGFTATESGQLELWLDDPDRPVTLTAL